MNSLMLVTSWYLFSASNHLLSDLSSGAVVAKDYPVSCVAFSPDGKLLVWGGGKSEFAGFNGDIALWSTTGYVKWSDLNKRALITRETRLPDIVDRLAFTADGSLLAAGVRGSPRGSAVYLINTKSGQISLALTEQSGSVSSLAFSANGELLAVGRWQGSVDLWDTANWRKLKSFRYSASASAFTFSSVNKDLLVEVSEGVRRINLATGHEKTTKLECSEKPGIFAAAISVAGNCIATGHGKTIDFSKYNNVAEMLDDIEEAGQVGVWDLNTGKQKCWLQGHKRQVWIVAFSRDGERVASGSDDGNIKVWDIAKGQEISSFRAHEGTPSCLALSPTGKLLASCSWDQTVKLWRIGK